MRFMCSFPPLLLLFCFRCEALVAGLYLQFAISLLCVLAVWFVLFDPGIGVTLMVTVKLWFVFFDPGIGVTLMVTVKHHFSSSYIAYMLFFVFTSIFDLLACHCD